MSTQQTCLYDRYFSTQASRGNTPSELSAKWKYYDELTVRRAGLTDPQARILELGCGYGRLLLTLRRLGFHNLRGVDLSQEQVQLAGKLGLDCVVRGDALSFLKDAPAGKRTPCLPSMCSSIYRRKTCWRWSLPSIAP